jgi:glycosyltransferase involved in cell wall biosynthesis
MAVPDAEFVLVDDGSTDGTLQLARALQEHYGAGRIIVIPLGGNQGAQIARNRGIESASGEMILFCDSDDVLVTSGVNELVESLNQNPNLDYAYGMVVMTDEGLVPLQKVSPIGCAFEYSPIEIAGYHWHTMGALYRKSFLAKVGPWNPDLTGSQDWEYQARVKLTEGRGLFVDFLVGYWRQHDGGRVGTKKFRPDYVRSVVAACEVILKDAVHTGHSDSSLRRRLAKKLIIHALECGEARDVGVRSLCFAQARRTLRGDVPAQFVCALFSHMPPWMDGLLWRHITGQKFKR